MKTVLLILVSFFVAGCAVKGYTHDVYKDGHLTEHYKVSVIDSPLLDFQAKSSHVLLKDGTVWDLGDPVVKTDPAAAAAVQSLGQGLITAGAAALKVGL